MKNSIFLLLFVVIITSCKSSSDVEPSVDSPVFTIFGTAITKGTETITSPKLIFSTYTSSGCNTKGTIVLQGADSKGREIEIGIFDLTNLEGTNTIKNTACGTIGYLQIGTNATKDWQFNIPSNTQFTYNKSSNSLTIKDLTLVSVSTFNAVTINVSGKFQ